MTRTKADLHYEMLQKSKRLSQGKPVVDFADLIKIRPIDRVAELMSLEYSNQEIADLLGYGSAYSVDGIVQRIRGQLGWQAT